MFSIAATNAAQKRKAEVTDPGQVLQPSRKRNQTEPPLAATQRDPSKLYTVVDLFFATPAQVASGTRMRKENVPMTYCFVRGNLAMHSQLWSVAEQHWQQARQQAGLSFLKDHLRSANLSGEPTVPLHSWLLYQVGMAELEVGTQRALRDASAHLRASQSLTPMFYPASVALGVCHVLLGQTKDGEAALRRGLWVREQLVVPNTPSGTNPLLRIDAPGLLGFVVCLRPAWTMAHRAREEATKLSVPHPEAAATTARAAAQYARLATSPAANDRLANGAGRSLSTETDPTLQPGEKMTR